ncbi:MAG: hypothetical protein L6420_08975 [Elusimicrobia bacterium]|nr:hypothetical protein [Elusimicrobiota bacterium]
MKEKVSFDKALRAVKIFIASPGKKKLLEIYGGEPLLYFDLVDKIISKAFKMAEIQNKDLVISVASNGVLMDEKSLRYMADNNIRFSISFSGSRTTQNFNRKFHSGKGTHKYLKSKIPRMLSIMRENAHVIFCVHPERVKYMRKDFLKLIELGFKNIGIECVHGFKWRKGDYRQFDENMRRIISFILKRARKLDFILLESFLEFFREREYKNSFCPFLRDFEMYPDGSFSLYPYPFIKNLSERKKVVIGDIEKGIEKKFLKCLPDLNSEKCANCLKNYYKLNHLRAGSLAYKMRTEISKDAVKKIIFLSRKETNFKRYLKYLIKEFKKGYT